MIEDGGVSTSMRMMRLSFVNFLVVMLLPIWAGVMIADFGAIGVWVSPLGWDPANGNPWLLTIAAIGSAGPA